MIASVGKYHKFSIVLVLISAFVYYYLGYPLVRTDVTILLSLYGTAFLCFFGLIRLEKEHFFLLAGIAVVFRLIFLGSIPNLSQDFYRFIWDGRMLLEGWNPYLYLPKDLIASGTAPIQESQALFDGMGSLNASNYTNYTPINQICFVIAGLIAPKSITGAVIVLRIILILADIGTLYFGRKLLKNLGISTHNIWLFILNPLVIVELVGNLHFEGLMIFFLVWSLYLLQKGSWKWAAIILALSVSVKLLPFIFLPILFQWFTKFRITQFRKNSITTLKKGIGKLIVFYTIVFVIVIGLFLPFISEDFIANYKATIGLYFQKFEFNASFYYIARWIGYKIVGWNMIEDIGRITPYVVFTSVMIISFFRDNTSFKKAVTGLLFGLSIYFFTTTTMHPWYFTTLLALSVFTNYRFTVVWSFMFILSYATYGNEGYVENLSFVALEYIVVYGFLCYEIYTLYRKNSKLKLS
ncbi:mannosyltransferase [Kordia sp.]|uniref:mannosyltransferase n=1 Tax=Kordia sp. TaxID=1965332 RepID=UPI003B5A5651